MSEDWTAEVADALGEVGMICTLRRAPKSATGATQANPYITGQTTPLPSDYPITAVQGMVKVKDANGTFIGQTMRKLTMAAGGVVPLKSDTIAVNVHPDDVVSGTIFHDIVDIQELSPAGVAVNYGILIAD